MGKNREDAVEELDADDLLKRLEEPKRKRRRLDPGDLDDAAIRKGSNGVNNGTDAAIGFSRSEGESGEDGEEEQGSSADEGEPEADLDSEDELAVVRNAGRKDDPSRWTSLEISRVALLSQKEDLDTKERVKSNHPKTSSFADLGVSKSLVSSLSSMSIRTPTEVQTACIPSLLAGVSHLSFSQTELTILKGRDCVGNAKTGSGKTIAFALPILQKLSVDPYGIYALVLTPTRY